MKKVTVNTCQKNLWSWEELCLQFGRFLVLKNLKQIEGLHIATFIEPQMLPLLVTATYSITLAENVQEYQEWFKDGSASKTVKPDGQTSLKEALSRGATCDWLRKQWSNIMNTITIHLTHSGDSQERLECLKHWIWDKNTKKKLQANCYVLHLEG